MIRKCLFTIGLILIFEGCVYGQIGDIIGRRQSRTEQPPKKNTSILTKRLAKEITKNTYSDSEKVYAIYHWIATNITYDNQLQLNAALQKEIYVSEENVIKNVLERRKALCGGFAFLFKELCHNVGISAEVVNGFTKDYSSKIIDVETPTHTWNVVKVNGNWELLDITWAVGYGNELNPDNFWYLTKPEDFILSHYPQDPRWTLLDGSVSFAEFNKR